MKTMIKTECSGCNIPITVNITAGKVTAGKATDRVYFMDGDNALAMWECPVCGYSDSHVEYID